MRLSIWQSLKHQQDQRANWLAQGLDAPGPKGVTAREISEKERCAAIKLSFQPRPQGWWLMFCEHDQLLSGRCRKCKR